MANKKMSETSTRYGLLKMRNYALGHGFEVIGDYKVVKAHEKKNKMKDIFAHGRKRISSSIEGVCEVLKVSLSRRGRESVQGYLVAYPGKSIRFDVRARY